MPTMSTLPVPASKFPNIDTKRLIYFESLLFDAIAHRIVFAHLEEMGFASKDDPTIPLTKDIISNAPPNGILREDETMSVDILNLHLLGQRSLAARYAMFIRTHGAAKEADLGLFLVSQVETVKPNSTEQSIPIIRAAMNMAYGTQ
jgi:hypothetical protein